MNYLINWLSRMLESMANAFMHPLKNDLPPSIGTHAYSSIPPKRKFRRKFNQVLTLLDYGRNDLDKNLKFISLK